MNMDGMYESECTKCGMYNCNDLVCNECINKSLVDFGHWLVNAPAKEKFKRSWIEQKLKQYLKEKLESSKDRESVQD